MRRRAPETFVQVGPAAIDPLRQRTSPGHTQRRSNRIRGPVTRQRRGSVVDTIGGLVARQSSEAAIDPLVPRTRQRLTCAPASCESPRTDSRLAENAAPPSADT